MDREPIEKLAADVKRRREEAEAEAETARTNLIRQASVATRLSDVDPDLLRAAADDFAGAAERLKLLEGFARELRSLLM